MVNETLTLNDLKQLRGREDYDDFVVLSNYLQQSSSNRFEYLYTTPDGSLLEVAILATTDGHLQKAAYSEFSEQFGGFPMGVTLAELERAINRSKQNPSLRYKGICSTRWEEIKFLAGGKGMCTKQLLQAVQTVGSDIQTLLNYLALSGEHFGTHAIVDPFGNVLLEHKFHMTDKGEIVKTIVHEDGFEQPTHPMKLAKLTLEELLAIVSYTKTQPPSEGYKDTFKNKWEEIEKVAQLNLGLNDIMN